MTSLAGVFVALLGLVAVAIALYAPRYHEPGPRHRASTCAPTTWPCSPAWPCWPRAAW